MPPKKTDTEPHFERLPDLHWSSDKTDWAKLNVMKYCVEITPDINNDEEVRKAIAPLLQGRINLRRADLGLPTLPENMWRAPQDFQDFQYHRYCLIASQIGLVFKAQACNINDAKDVKWRLKGKGGTFVVFVLAGYHIKLHGGYYREISLQHLHRWPQDGFTLPSDVLNFPFNYQ